MPARPYAFLSKEYLGSLDLSQLGTEISQAEDKRQEAYDASRKIKAALVRAKAALESGGIIDAPEFEALERLVMDTVGATATRTPREANLGLMVQDHVRHKAFLHFLQDGTLLAPSAFPYATDEEYLAGACMGLAQDLAKYGIGRATARDADSVFCAKTLVSEILEYLLQFDFRNGPLRRKYDGTKYALKTLETLLYELAVTGTSIDRGDDDGEKPSKVPKIDNAPTNLLAGDELKQLRERMEHRDSLRETLIKRCRDGQKAAKQAIFALHRGDFERAKALIHECEECIHQGLLPIVEEEPSLRYGSFANVMEEYVEAKLFYGWLFRDTTTVPSEGTLPPAKIMMPLEFEAIPLETTEPWYLGGLCDLTGEVGRFAVQRATSRDEVCVKLCLQTNKSILMALQMMERFPREIAKKLEQLEKSVEKIERILYEMSLSEASGRNVHTSSMDMELENKEGVDGNAD
jgi:predicted translin family RNA/ssDNA-binding protein